jgi:hypothetical protein
MVISKQELLNRIQCLEAKVGVLRERDVPKPTKLSEREVLLVCQHGIEIEKVKIFDLNGFTPPWFIHKDRECEFVGVMSNFNFEIYDVKKPVYKIKSCPDHGDKGKVEILK